MIESFACKETEKIFPSGCLPTYSKQLTGSWRCCIEALRSRTCGCHQPIGWRRFRSP